MIDEKQLLFECLNWEQEHTRDAVTNDVVAQRLQEKEDVFYRVKEEQQAKTRAQKVKRIRTKREVQKRKMQQHNTPWIPNRDAIRFELSQMDTGLDSIMGKEYGTEPRVNPVLLSHLGKKYGYTSAYKVLEGIPDQDNLAASAQRISKAYHRDFEAVAIGVMQLGADITDKLANHAERFGNKANDYFNCLVDNYERSVTIENTAYLLSGRLCDRVKENPTELGLLTDKDAYRLIALGEGIEGVVRSDRKECAGALRIPGVVFVDLLETGKDWSALAAYRQDRRVPGNLEKHILQSDYGRKDNPLGAVENVQMHDSDK